MPISPGISPALTRKTARALVLAVALSCAGLGANPAPAAPARAPTTAAPIAAAATTADDGAHVASETWLDSRMVDLEIASPAVGSTVPVRLLVPPGWSPTATQTWPVLYLLQGAHDDYTSWTRETDIESFTANLGVIVAMPSSGPTGIPTAWYNGGTYQPDYETFDVTELWQLLQRDYRASAVRAVAGVSTGGYGAVMMAAHHPGAFTAAASYSGILDTTFPGIPAIMDAIVMRENLAADSLWGDPTANAALWTLDNPYAQAADLRGTKLFISQGTGFGTSSSGDPLGAGLEAAIFPQAVAFTIELNALGIPATTDFYLGGVHDWSSWQGTFTVSWPMLAGALGLSS